MKQNEIDEILKLFSPQQRQDALLSQIRDVYIIAVKMKCYDAADWIQQNANCRFVIKSK
jgi:acid stress-induced BolA-like protein IbaG/YrbA